MSFGTFIGTVYANLFPTRIRSMALDGAYDPEAYANEPYTYDYWQYVALEGALRRFLDWCANSPGCAFGHGDPGAAYGALVSDLDDNPLRDAHGKVVANGATLTYRVMFALNAGRPAWSGIAKDFSAAQQRGGPYVDSIGSKSSFFAANVSVECGDRIYPPSKLLLPSRLALSTASAPRTGPVAAYGPPGYDHSQANACQQWPAKRASRYSGPWNAHGSAPILVVGTTGDPDTPYQDAVTLAATLESGHLLTFVGEGHSGFAHSRCSRAAEVAYLGRRLARSTGHSLGWCMKPAVLGYDVTFEEAPRMGGQSYSIAEQARSGEYAPSHFIGTLPRTDTWDCPPKRNWFHGG